MPSPEWNGPETEKESVAASTEAPETVDTVAPTVSFEEEEPETAPSFEFREAHPETPKRETEAPELGATPPFVKAAEQAVQDVGTEFVPSQEEEPEVEPAPETLRSAGVTRPEQGDDVNVISAKGTTPVSREAASAGPAVIEEVPEEEEKSSWRKFWDSVRGKDDGEKVA